MPRENGPAKLLREAKATRSAFPRSIQPELATLVSVAPAGDKWLHEIKFDGYRLLAYVNRGSVSLVSRNQNDWTTKFPAITKALAKLPVKQVVLDGEVAVVL